MVQDLNFKLGFELPKESKLNKADTSKLYDVIIIGAGPAGMTATIYCARKKLNTLVLTKDLGGQVLSTSWIENYTGYQYISGKELADKFAEQIKQFSVDFEQCSVELLKHSDSQTFSVITNEKTEYRSKAVVISSGKRSRMLNVPGEKELGGRGVTYCSICDAPLFKDQNVAVIGGGNSAVTAAIDLLSYAKHIDLINNLSYLQADTVLTEQIKSPILNLYLGYKVNKIIGENRVTGISISPVEKSDNIEKVLDIGGVFIEIGLIPNVEFVKDLIDLNNWNEIIVDCVCATSVTGLFAAGDVTSVPEKQIIVACGEGAKAALGVYKYLLTNKLL